MFFAALWSPSGKGLTSWLSCMWFFFLWFCCFPIWSWVWCGIWVYWFLMFAFHLILILLLISCCTIDVFSRLSFLLIHVIRHAYRCTVTCIRNILSYIKNWNSEWLYLSYSLQGHPLHVCVWWLHTIYSSFASISLSKRERLAICVFVCLCYRSRLFLTALWLPAGKGLTSLVCNVLFVSICHFSKWCPRSCVVLDCIGSWSLPSFLLSFNIWRRN